MAEFAAVAIECVGFEAEFPGEHVGGVDVFDGAVAGQVDGFADRAAEEWLGGGHHADVAFGADESLARSAAFVGAIEDRIVLEAEMRCTFDGHGAADVIVGFLDFFFGEAERLEHVEIPVVELLVGEAEIFAAEIFAERPFVECELEF